MHDFPDLPDGKNPQPPIEGGVGGAAYFPSNSNDSAPVAFGQPAGIGGQGPLEGVQEKITKSIDRITEIDIARALCILGMVIAHFTSTLNPANFVTVMLSTVNGRASLAFVFVAGIGVTLLDRAKGPRESGLTLLWRAAILIPMGIVLQEVSPGPVLILQFYAFYYLVGWLGARLPTPALIAVIPIWTIVGCAVWWQGTPHLSIGYLAMPLGDQLLTILYSGQYPVITWAPMVLLGVLIGRLDLRNQTVQLVLAWVAALVIAAVHLFLYTAEPIALAQNGSGLPGWLVLEHHSNSITYLVDGYASAVLMVSLCLRYGSRLGKVGEWLAIAGRQALTLYVVHMVWYVVLNGVLDAIYFGSPVLSDSVSDIDFDRWMAIFEASAYAAAFLCFGLLVLQAVIWNRFFGMGPLERLLRRPSVFRA